MKTTRTDRISHINWLKRGLIDDVLIKIGNDAGIKIDEGVKAFLRGDLVLAEPRAIWREENGIIYLPAITTDGTSGEAWIKRLEDGGFKVGDKAKTILKSSNFKATSGITIYIAILLEIKLFSKKSSTMDKEVDAKAFKYGFSKPNIEISCLILEQLKNRVKKMGLCGINIMHNLVKTQNEEKYFMCNIDTTMNRLRISNNFLHTTTEGPGFFRATGFAYVASQVNAKSQKIFANACEEIKMRNIKDIEKLTRREINEVLIKIGLNTEMHTETGINAFLKGHFVLVNPELIWHKEDGVIYFPTTTTVTEIKQRIGKGYNVEKRR